MISFLRGAVIACLLAAVAPAQVETYRIDMNVDRFEYGSVFGVNSAPYTFSLTFTFDLTTHPHIGVFPQHALEGPNATGNWYAFSAESVTAISGSFGTQSFGFDSINSSTIPTLEEEEPDNVPRYVFLADTDLTTSPAFVQFGFELPTGSGFSFTSYSTEDGPFADLNTADYNTDGRAYGSAFSITRLTVVPEPSTYAAIAGVCALGLAVWRRRRASSAARDQR